MAILLSALAVQQLDNKTKRVPGIFVTGDVATAVAKYTFTGDELVNDVIRLVKLPPGVIVLPHLCRVVNEALGTSAAGTVGDTLGTPDADKYSTSIALATAGNNAFAGVTAGALTPVPTTDEVWVTLTITAGTALGDQEGQELTAYIAYAAQN